MSVRDFGAHVGLSARLIAKWEAEGKDLELRPANQQLLDRCLEGSDTIERARFEANLRETTCPGTCVRAMAPEAATRLKVAESVAQALTRPDMRQALADRDIAGVFRILGKHGVSQRQIAALTGQSQSEISEIRGGRRVVAYDVLVRVGDGLGVPRGYMGLAYDETTAPLVSASNSARNDERRRSDPSSRSPALAEPPTLSNEPSPANGRPADPFAPMSRSKRGGEHEQRR